MKKRTTILIALLLTMVMLVFAGCAQQQAPKEEAKKEETKPAANKEVILATTTSTQDSGLLDVLQPEFEKKTGYKLKVIAVGTGAALKMGEKGEADVLLVHAPKSEKPLVDSGVGINYSLVMHNDFILVGPESDPAGIKDAKTTAEAMKKIYDKGSIFVSRGDDSGTHKKELDLWKEAKLEPKGQKWYQESGSGMGATLNIASEKQGYTLTDRATYLAQKGKVKLAVLKQGDKSLLNIYHVMNVNPEKFNKVNAEGGKAFVDFMVSKETQEIIGKFGVDKYGEPLFFPDAGKDK
ncbi:tungstate transport system substrate-binding protein [Desulforamulus putei DSM 12395]|uniref:Tungstate transport system substrate-binding protein n=1 Tax=Desulforamulus putei DSM 12395 TaxID=1121429 RepID=A0A1M5CPW3_9FIRM|nr:substrate-binding domain-containing protein [Desulforamulus putei]SHF56780.1 tungstate transport system substrate-binding protein [Desulforamulus putei DSM 12395]